MHRPRIPVSAPKAVTTPESELESPSGFWPLGATGRAVVLSYTGQPNEQCTASTVADGDNAGYVGSGQVGAGQVGAGQVGIGHYNTISDTHLSAIRRHAGTLADPIGFFTALFACAPIGCSVLKADGHVLMSNAASHALFGSEPPAEYNAFTDNLAIEHGIVTAIRRAFLGETITLPTVWYDPREINTIAVTEGKRVAISMTLFPIPNAQQAIEHVAIIYRDDTDVTLAQQQLKEQSEQLEHHIISRTAELEEANEELEAFSYSVSHDLRAPLRAIDGFAALLSEDQDSHLSDNSQDCLRRIRGATARMSDLINDLLDFSRLGKQALTLKPVEPMRLVHQVLQELEPKLRDRAIHIRVGKLPLCQADAALLREVFLNLLDNAIKFTSNCEHAKIEIGTRIQDDQLVWFVSDNGVGFDMEHYGQLFGVFSRLHSLEEFEGTGVGLALVNRIVKRHGGEIWAFSERGKGATFYFTLTE